VGCCPVVLHIGIVLKSSPKRRGVFSPKETLKVILLEAIEVLENSRNTFKSKELEALRKKLIRVLAEDTQL